MTNGRGIEAGGNGGSFLQELAVTPLGLEAEGKRPQFIGGITYNRGNNLLVIAHQDHRLVTGELNAKKERAFLGSMQDTGRLITLNTFQTVNIRQVDMAGIDIRKTPSVHRQQPISAHFSVTNPESGAPERLAVTEEDILDIFTGERGGIAVFSGKGFPDETGLLFERETEDEKQALILFMHPEEATAEGMNSIEGLQSFLTQLNSEMGDDTALQVQALNAIHNYERKGRVDFRSNMIRKEIFRLQVLALTRGVARGEERFLEDVHDLVPQTANKFFTASLRVPVDYQETVDESIDTVLVDFRHPLFSEDPEARSRRKWRSEVEIPLEELLQTEKAQHILTAYDATYRDNVATRTKIIHGINDWINTAVTLTELEDIARLTEYTISGLYRDVTQIPSRDGKVVHDKMEFKLHMQDRILAKRAELGRSSN